MKKIKNRVHLFSLTHNVRRGQAVSPFGVGAMIDFIDQTLMSAAPEYWKKSGVTIHDERLEKVLGVNEFRMPQSYDDDKQGLPFVRFPEWYFCPSCRAFKPIKDWEKVYKANFKPRNKSSMTSTEMRIPTCLECKSRPHLVPARIVVVCENGHIQDFPWVEWVHIQSDQDICSKPRLRITTGANTAGLEGIKIECDNCKAKTTMKNSFNEGIFDELNEKLKEKNLYSDRFNFSCKGYMPWKGQYENCNIQPRAAQRGASNVYFPKVDSSIVIPPYSNKITIDIESSRYYKEFIERLERDTNKGKREEFLAEYLEDFIEDISEDTYYNKEKVEKIILRKINFKDNDSLEEENKVTRNEYRQQEYKAIVDDSVADDEISKDFKIERIEAKEYELNFINKVVIVHKLREVRALTGFTRLNPPDQTIISYDDGTSSVLVSVKEDKTTWYPAYEVRGEGIFIEFKDEVINDWIEKHSEIQNRANIINERYKRITSERNMAERTLTPKFLLLHTLSHLLIRQLSFDCGYSAASLRERIYCDEPSEDYKMQGVLIYTASGDSEGTLGGLVRQGKPDRLKTVIENAIYSARWCSSDPVCIESLGQGRDSLNLSACHACTLLSETSCEEFNLLLDRVMIIGKINEPEIGFFSQLL